MTTYWIVLGMVIGAIISAIGFYIGILAHLKNWENREMIKQYCTNCRRETWHNQLAKNKGHRCTYCGSPVGNGPGSERRALAMAYAERKAKGR